MITFIDMTALEWTYRFCDINFYKITEILNTLSLV